MPKQVKHGMHPKDVSQMARHSVGASAAEPETGLPSREQISALMSELGRKGGKIGGKRRLETMTAQQRSENARLAARTRWNKNKPQ